ncbi:peptidase M23 family protein [Nesterenkonia sp. AN1]|uniref:M23 family metallopeptidase n=1 Tax=Nesterenkonia sp. AN1 TaxID=652017 RepID=UPI00044E9521|nr:M23 family metallopeptidase [Nesterenkonia sp. AN1]EXF25760.1 peptidase M23 family protein [Nesterenkonia sp. AN1]
MRRTISRLKPLWLVPVFFGATLGVLSLFGAVPSFIEAVPSLVVIAAIALGVVLMAVHPKAAEHEPHVMAAPVRGRWAALNSPGQQLPSHGSRFLGQYAAIDLLQPSTPETPAKVRKAWRNSRPEEYPCFGAQVYSMAPGVVAGTLSRVRDHRARNTWQGLIYMMALEGMLRSVAGRGAILGNHVIVAHDDGTAAVYAHLRQGSVLLEVGQRVSAGEQLGEVGNTGNSSEPHLHVHLMDRMNPNVAAGLTLTWENIQRAGEIEPSLEDIAKEPEPNAIRSMPRNGEIFEA